MTELPESTSIQVDRTRGLVRGLWRLLVAIGSGGLVALLLQWDWHILWQAQRASFLAMGALLIGLVAVTLALLITAVRWLALAAWFGRLGIDISQTRLAFCLGPFGTTTYDWRRISVTVEGDIDPEYLDLVPDEALCLSLHHPDSRRDLVERIHAFSDLEPERITGLLRRFVNPA